MTVVPGPTGPPGHLLVASHLDFLDEVLKRAGSQLSLGKTTDYLAVNEALTKLGAGNNSFRYFTRTDKAYHPTYELVRQGKMPEAETILGSLLNKWFEPDEEGVLREQQIKGKKLPEFEKVRASFGPAGLYVDSEDDGWFITGCLLRKSPAAPSGTKPTRLPPSP